MAEFEIGSVVVDDKVARRDLESFAVCYDYLSRVDARYLRSQRNIFFASSAATVAGAAAIVGSFLTDLPILLPGAALIGIGVAGLAGFLLRRPKGLVDLRKVFRPLALVPVRVRPEETVMAVDCTETLWKADYGTDLLLHDTVDGCLSRLPISFSHHDEEKEAMRELRSLDSFTSRSSIAVPAAKAVEWRSFSSLAVPVESEPARALPGLDWPAAEMKGRELSKLVEDCRSEVLYVEECTAHLSDKVGGYLQSLEAVQRDQVDRSCNALARFASETERTPRFFDPLINSFLDDARDGLTMVEKASQRELDLIDGRLQMDQSYIDLLLDRMSLNVKMERDHLHRDGGLRDNRLASIDRLAGTIALAKEANLKPMQPGLAETLRSARPAEEERPDPGQAMLDRAQEGAGAGVFIDSAVSPRLIAPDELAYTPRMPVETAVAKQHRMADPLTESQLKRYDGIAQRTRTLLDSIMKDMMAASEELGDLVDGLKGKVTGDVKRVEMQLLAGKKAISAADIYKEEDYQRIRREVDQLEDLRAFVLDMMTEAEGMMVEGAVRHLRPYAERAEAFESERVRLEKAFKQVAASCAACERAVDGIAVAGGRPGRYHVPYWIVGSRTGGEARGHVYTISSLDGKGGVKETFPQLTLDQAGMKAMGLGKEEVDLGLISDITSSRKAYQKVASVPWLNAFIVERGVKKLGKGA